jgi:predicted transcriptional regulator
MDFLEKLNYLMEKNHLNKSTLSKACNIPYTTIDGWYKKGYEGLKLTTLRKLAEYFGTSLDYWASENTDAAAQISKDKSLSEIHQKALAQLEKMNDEQVKAVLAFINSLDELEKSFQPTSNNSEK